MPRSKYPAGPETRTAVAAKASAVWHGRPLVELDRDLNAARAADLGRAIIAMKPQLTPAQRRAVIAILESVDQ